MANTKEQRPDSPSTSAVIGIAWYNPEEWERVRATATDAILFEGTFEEWESMAIKNISIVRKVCPTAMKVFIVAEEFFAWCHFRRRTNNAEGRAEFVSEKVRSSAASGKTEL